QDRCLHQLIEAQAARSPDRVAVLVEGESLTYRELNRRANQLARHLRQLGVGPDVLVGVLTERSLEMVVSLLGILKAGGAYVPLVRGARVALATRDEALDGQRLMQRMSSSGATVMQATPATWRLLLESGWNGNPRLKVLCGGEALSRNLADDLLRRATSVWNVYGPTETIEWSTAWRVEAREG